MLLKSACHIVMVCNPNLHYDVTHGDDLKDRWAILGASAASHHFGKIRISSRCGATLVQHHTFVLRNM